MEFDKCTICVFKPISFHEYIYHKEEHNLEIICIICGEIIEEYKGSNICLLHPTKICTLCNVNKEINDFSLYRSKCKTCLNKKYKNPGICELCNELKDLLPELNKCKTCFNKNHKKCAHCLEIKEAKEFYTDRRKCKTCMGVKLKLFDNKTHRKCNSCFKIKKKLMSIIKQDILV